MSGGHKPPSQDVNGKIVSSQGTHVPLRFSYHLFLAKHVLPYSRASARDSINKMYETFEHTADLGLRIRATDLNQLFVEAAQALFSAIVDDLGTVEPKQRIDVSLQGDDLGYLLFDWLNELLYRFDTEHLLFGKFEARIENQNLRASAWGEPLDPSRHSLAHEVKAITYHGLRVEKENDAWLAEVIVDI